jgi:AraC family transcriptional regulator, melibiose operon regulatory protein
MSLYNQSLLIGDYYPYVTFYYYKEWQDFSMEMHQHNSVEIMYVMHGSCKVEMEGETSQLKQGQFIIIDANIPHRLLVTEERCRMANIEFSFRTGNTNFLTFKQVAEETPSLMEMLYTYQPFLLFLDSNDIYSCLKNVILELDKKGVTTDFMVQLLLSQLMIRISEIAIQDDLAPEKNIYNKKAIEFIHQNYDRQIRVKDIADAVHIHPGYLHRIFRQTMGCSINDYLMVHRIKKAKELIVNTEIRLTDIPYYVGINSQQYFCTIFRKYTKQTPREFRKKQQCLYLQSDNSINK